MNLPPDGVQRALLSGVVTTYNNAATLEACLASLAFCDELVVLDSDSDDDTRAITARHGAKVSVQPFQGYGAQKQAAIDLARHDWVLLLDADEHLTEAGRVAIERELAAPRAQGYRLPRQEWLFWRWPHPATRPNWQLRLLRRSHGRMNAVPVHAAPEVQGAVIDLDAPFRHYGEPQLADRVDKINR
jgi:glycosyltransferase involved in cell wall biosynthesis